MKALIDKLEKVKRKVNHKVIHTFEYCYDEKHNNIRIIILDNNLDGVRFTIDQSYEVLELKNYSIIGMPSPMTIVKMADMIDIRMSLDYTRL